jgi:hypothetical protein
MLSERSAGHSNYKKIYQLTKNDYMTKRPIFGKSTKNILVRTNHRLGANSQLGGGLVQLGGDSCAVPPSDEQLVDPNGSCAGSKSY